MADGKFHVHNPLSQGSNQLHDDVRKVCVHTLNGDGAFHGLDKMNTSLRGFLSSIMDHDRQNALESALRHSNVDKFLGEQNASFSGRR